MVSVSDTWIFIKIIFSLLQFLICSVSLISGANTELLPFGSQGYEPTPTTTTVTTLPPWMTQKTTPASWTKATTKSPWQTTPWTSATTVQKVVTQAPTQPTQAPTQQGQSTLNERMDCDAGEHKAHASDCSKFYQCNQGKFEERKCFPGLHWAKTVRLTFNNN